MSVRIRFSLITRMLCALPLAGLPMLASGLAAQEPPQAAAPELTPEEMARFLLDAEIREMHELSVGVTDSRRAVLSDGVLTHDAHIQTVDIFRKRFVSKRGVEFFFRDSYNFNIAAYRLDRLLGLGMVPVSVERRVVGESAAVTWWVDDVMMSGTEYLEDGRRPPAEAFYSEQKAQARVFQQLIANSDPNLGNFVIDEDWQVWLVDFTRAFRKEAELENRNILQRIGRGLFDSLRSLDEDQVERELGPHLKKWELDGLLARREAMIEHFEELIAARGEPAVLITRPGF